MQLPNRPKALRDRAFRLRITIKDLAAKTGYPRPRVSRVLSGRETSAPMLDKVEAVLDAAEAETQEVA